MEWGDLHSELTNKIRWAIGTTAGGSGEVNIPYSQSMAMARQLSGMVVETLKAGMEKPDLNFAGYMRQMAEEDIKIPVNGSNTP